MRHAVRRFLALLALPYFRWELPGWQRLSALVGLPIRHEALWAGARPRIVRGKLHGMLMKLDMRDWCERLTFFLGRYYELPLELALRVLVAPAETYVDVGGNIGMATLMGAAAVGPDGVVHTFEPNPAMAVRIREAVDLNGLRNVTIHPVGLSDAKETLTLTTVAQSSGWATFGEVLSKDPSLTYGTLAAGVARGDDLLRALAGVVTIKIDVEGFECRVLRGMEQLIGRLRPAIITELDRHLLTAAGATAGEMFAVMAAHGYRGYEMDITSKVGKAKLRLRPLEESMYSARNVLWVHPATVHNERIKPYLAR